MSAFAAYRAASPAIFGWTPSVLGASLVAWWDAERADLITQAANAVSSWTDIVGGFAQTQSTGASQPIYSATSFNGRPGVTFDGVAQRLVKASGTLSATIPTGAAASEIWALCSQDALPADTTVRTPFSYGSATNTLRRLERNVVTATNRGRTITGTGAAVTTAANLSVDLSGRHVMRGSFGATASQLDVDAVAGTSAAAVPSTGTTGMVIGSSSSSAVALWSGAINTVLITLPLDATQAALLYTYLNRRL